MASSSGFRLGVDIGGTFTDVVLLGADGTLWTRKVLSTPADYAAGVIEGALLVLEEAGVDAGEVAGVVHATTVASNTVLEGNGARTALITSEGFRDVLEMRRLRIPVMYDLQYDKPPPLVPRRRRYEVAERVGPGGEVRVRLERASVEAVAAQIKEDGVDAAAIALLHSYANPEHEHLAAELVRETLGDGVFLSCSADILPEIREYERTSTAVVNAYVGPAVTRYVRSLLSKLESVGFSAPLEIMHSGGGTLSPQAALKRPAYLIESGPAAGVIACAHLARETERPNMISFDMGGTTAKAAMLEDGEPVRTTEYEIGGGINLSSRLVKGGGYAIKLPFIDMSEIGSGGGSIVTVDELGAATVGPRSAGAAPGPVCYARGGTEPTLADALAVLGLLNSESLADGAVVLDVDAAAAVIERKVASPLGLPLLEAAHGVLMVAVATMTRAVKAVSTYRGRDPRDFVLCAFGGNGPVVGVEVARALSMRRVLIPPAPGVFSAVGLLFSNSEQEFVRTLLQRSEEIDPDSVTEEYRALAEEAWSSLAEEGIAPQSAGFSRLADLRYAGQAYELTVRVPEGQVDVDALKAAFVEEHLRTYGHGSAHDPIDLVSIRLLARVPRAAVPASIVTAARKGRQGGANERRAYFGPEVGSFDVRVVERSDLQGEVVSGPVFADEYDSTTVIPPGCSATLDRFGCIDIRVD
jgi:N-methylhydantoinase A